MLSSWDSEMCFRARARKTSTGETAACAPLPCTPSGSGLRPEPQPHGGVSIGTTGTTRRRTTDSDANRAHDRGRARPCGTARRRRRRDAERLRSHGADRRFRHGRAARNDAPCPVRGVVAYRQQHQPAGPRVQCRHTAAAPGGAGRHEGAVRPSDAGRNHPSPRRRVRDGFQERR